MRNRMIRLTSLAIVVFSFYYWLAFRAYGYDWAITEIFSEVLSSAGAGISGFPYFSYFYNGGVYLFHDPQAFVTSPLLWLFTELTGNLAAPRWLGVAYGVIGFFTTYAGFRSRFSRRAAAFGALAFSLSLGMFWRMAAGHMLFLLQMIFPFVLLLIDRIEKRKLGTRRMTWIVSLALISAWLVYEPGFHALFYFIVPALVLDITLRLFSDRRSILRAVPALALSAVLAILMVLPKILAWVSLPMSRAPDATDGALSMKDVFVGIFVTARAAVMGFHVPGSNPERWHFIFEVNTALFPVATLLAFVGIGFGIRHRWYRERYFQLAALCLFFSIMVAGNATVWHAVQSLTSGSFRVPSRYLGLAAFGLAVFSAYGAEGILVWSKKYGAVLVSSLTVILLVLAGNWLVRASTAKTLANTPLSPIGFRTETPRFLMERYCPVASGCLNTYQDGYAEDPFVRFLSERGITENNFATHIPGRVKVEPTRVTLTSIRAGELFDLPLRFASFGHEIVSSPANLKIKTSEVNGHLQIVNESERDAEWIIISPKTPFPVWSSWVAFITFIFSIFLVAVNLFKRSRK